MLVQYSGAAACLIREQAGEGICPQRCATASAHPSTAQGAFPQQLYRVGLGRIQVIHECYRVPLPRPVEFVLLLVPATRWSDSCLIRMQHII